LESLEPRRVNPYLAGIYGETTYRSYRAGWRTNEGTWVVTIFLVLSAKGVLATPSEEASTKIEEGMTVEQVANAIGFRPTTVEEHSCGDGDTTPFWFCRIQTYADGKHTLVVYFNKLTEKPTWAVRLWIIR